MVASFVAPYVDSIFPRQGLIGDVHVTLNHELLLLYGGRLHSTDDGPIGHLVAGCCPPHHLSRKQGHTNPVRHRRSCYGV